MMGQLVGRSGSSLSNSRYFRYEVSGLRQSDETMNSDYQIRSSASVFITVPYNRMNEEMQRISRLGGKIINIEVI
jgi:phycocyanin-associated, rod